MVRKLLPPSDVDGVLGGTAANEKWKDLYTEKINGMGFPAAATSGDAGKSLVVSSTEDGYELGSAAVPQPSAYFRTGTWSRYSANILESPESYTVDIGGTVYVSEIDDVFGLASSGSWDATSPTDYTVAANRAGKDFYIYACVPVSGRKPVIVLSANSTYPSGYDGTNSRKIGGFHCLCVAVGTISGHPLSGFLAGDILPASCWDLQHRPLCSPEGMVWCVSAGIWVDIYLQSGTGTSTKSANGGTITDNRDWMDFVDDLGAVGKRLLDDGEFQKIAEGCNQETNIIGSADPGTTAGHVDTAGRRMISNIGCEDCAGVVYQWLLDQSYRVGTGAAWNWYDLPGYKGSLYNYSTDGTADIKLIAGGSWTTGTACGSRCHNALDYRWYVDSHLGARGCCGAM